MAQNFVISSWEEGRVQTNLLDKKKEFVYYFFARSMLLAVQIAWISTIRSALIND